MINRPLYRKVGPWLLAIFSWALPGGIMATEAQDWLEFQTLPDLPNSLGVAGPFAGVHGDALLVAGGANFAQPIWETQKSWHDRIYVLNGEGAGRWVDAGRLPRPIAYGATVSTPDGIICMGGNDQDLVYRDVFLLAWDHKTQTVTQTPYPALPKPCAYGAATVIGDMIYLAGGQSGLGLDSAMNNFWALDLSLAGTDQFQWQTLPGMPVAGRAFNLTLHQHNGYQDCVYVCSGRREADGQVEFLKDLWEFNPKTQSWRRRADAPRCVMAGAGIEYGQSHLFVLGGASGEFFHQTDQLKDSHPGFPREALAYHTITDSWTSAGRTPANQVTTTAVRWKDSIVLPSGEVRPRVRSPKVWRITVPSRRSGFGLVNYLVLGFYLAGMVGVGVYFARRNTTTDDYFRGGQRIPWWAAGCSIFATMLSSLTYTGIPSKAFAQDWVYAVGNFLIPVVAILAVYVALPFFRGIDATSAYEYLEHRFSRVVRMFGSLCFSLFHVFRMAVVMSLTGLALAVATPLTASQSVLLMGLLSILYCTLGGIEAVIWTDTLQTIVLLGGALLALFYLVGGIDGGWQRFVKEAHAADKFRVANLHWDVTHSQVALWVVVLGGLAQNVSSYTADQAVVQRYMTTADAKSAARSIWTNAVLSIPATLLFYGLGTGLYTFYRMHPERLDPGATTDQIFPQFIAHEMPVGVAGLIVAGVFAAAQSTVLPA